MNNFPRMMAFLGDMRQEKKMYEFEDINAILADMAEKGIVEPMIEPIDETDCHPLDWASVVGVDIFDEVYQEDNFCS
jgi:hypothetical protein